MAANSRRNMLLSLSLALPVQDDQSALNVQVLLNVNGTYTCRLKSPNGRDVTKRAIIDVYSIVSGRNCDRPILTSIIAKLLTSRPFGDLSHDGFSIHVCDKCYIQY